MMKQISLMITSVALTFAMNICAQQSPWDKADAIVQSLDPVTFPDKTYGHHGLWCSRRRKNIV